MDFKTKSIYINNWSVIRLPVEVSSSLPSRGMNYASIIINHNEYMLPLEPDGYGSHWFKFEPTNGVVLVTLTPLKKWLEPEITQDFKEALKTHNLTEFWQSLTTKARWEWVRWIRSTKVQKTRLNRIQKTCNKLANGMRRPCCFDTSKCTEPNVSSGGKLILVD